MDRGVLSFLDCAKPRFNLPLDLRATSQLLQAASLGRAQDEFVRRSEPTAPHEFFDLLFRFRAEYNAHLCLRVVSLKCRPRARRCQRGPPMTFRFSALAAGLLAAAAVADEP